MSLINDALKRAKDAQPATTPAPEPQQPMTPVEPPPADAKSSGLPPYFLPAVLIVLSGACWFLIKGWETKRNSEVNPQPLPVQAQEVAPAPAPEAVNPTPAPREFAATDLAAAATTPVSSNAVPAGSPAPRLAAPEPAPPPPPAFKLQGIFYRPANPSAVINAKTVFIGDIVDEARVKAIDRQSVTLVHAGETKVLTLR